MAVVMGRRRDGCGWCLWSQRPREQGAVVMGEVVMSAVRRKKEKWVPVGNAVMCSGEEAKGVWPA